ncbi:hypothetical protein FXV83_33440 [Bradyrhizobium hipponense]|uniref:Uncharacterized protein n=1 Tax=Bradyrhizobium hipponense TaxID=2605638 RepID=A0A5S4YD73_9BRAD|nr:hypothetical protein FXV83_33440 [Bradyrhizobium hipponense]
MLPIIKWNSRYSAREWVTTAGALVVQLSALNARRLSESKPRPPSWKHFDDTHHWDSTAEEWIPNDEVIVKAGYFQDGVARESHAINCSTKAEGRG